MKQFALFTWFRDISIAKKLYFTVGTMALLIAIELFTLWFSMNTLSAVRASVGAEGLWSKAQKDAVYTLRKYARSGKEEDYSEFQNLLKIHFGDRKAFAEIGNENPDLNIMREGYMEGGIHPDDVDGVVQLFIRFNSVSYIHKAIRIFHRADTLMSELQKSAAQLHSVITVSGISSPEKTEHTLNDINELNEKFTVLEYEFSATLGEGARWLEGLVLKILFSIALTVEISGLLLTISVSRGIAKGIDEIIRASKQVAVGNFKDKAVVYSKDEIGQLASSFNEMTGELELSTAELKKSEEQLQQFKHFFNHSNDFSCIANVQGYFEVLNPAFERVLGYSEKELLKDQFLAFIHPDDIPATLLEIEKLKTGAATINFVNRYRKKDGSYLWFDWNSTPDPVTGKLYAIARDITERKKAEESIMRLNKELSGAKDELEMKVLNRTAELQEANERLKQILNKLERYNKTLEEFAYMSSHNLRAPLANLTSLVTMYGQRKKGDAIFEKIQFTANQLNTIVSDLTELVTLDNPVADKKKFFFAELLEDIKSSIENQIQSSGAIITSDFSECDSITYPHSHLQSILLNLLTNAVKYRSPHRVPEIKLKTSKDGEYVKLSVGDNGMGIEEKHQETIFKAFKRLHQEMDGKGLGLYIVKRQVELLGGSIGVKSKPGEGSEFTALLKDNPAI